MGNFEKLVVVVVLLLSAVVLAVSLRGDDEKAAPQSPLEAAGAELAPTPIDGGSLGASQLSTDGAAPAEKQPEKPIGEKPDYLLDAASASSAITAPENQPSGSLSSSSGGSIGLRILRATQGLVPSALDDFMVYTPVEGDTWASLGERFYRDARYVSNLRDANEGMEALAPGVAILVPVYDFHHGSGSAAAVSGAPSVAPTASGTPTTYVVKDGDNLSGISKSVYGTATRWMEIYHANRDQLESPDWLKVGMKLRIPNPQDRPAQSGEKAPGAPAAAKPALTGEPKSTPPAEDKRRVQ